jgi:hypothetical protein
MNFCVVSGRQRRATVERTRNDRVPKKKRLIKRNLEQMEPGAPEDARVPTMRGKGDDKRYVTSC